MKCGTRIVRASPKHDIGDLVHFWTGRGSYGYAVITRFGADKIYLEPEFDAHRGSDFRILHSGAEYWAPRNFGVPLAQIDTPPIFWFWNR